MSVTLHKGENCGFTEKIIMSPQPQNSIKRGQTIFFENPPTSSGVL